jgi:ParB-like chromosome segregation protein Spo0J
MKRPIYARIDMIRRSDVEKRPIGSIVVQERRRAPTDERIAEMSASLRENGLLTPIAVRIAEIIVIDGEQLHGVPVLVCGATRLSAAKREGWTEIDTITVEGVAADFSKAEIVENLHRGELTKLERAEHITAYAQLIQQEAAQLGQVSSGGRGRKGGDAEVARRVGISRQEVQRAKLIASMPEAAKSEARAAGLDDNQDALLQLAKARTRSERTAAIETIKVRQQGRKAAKGTPTQQQLAALTAAWKKASPSVREEFLQFAIAQMRSAAKNDAAARRGRDMHAQSDLFGDLGGPCRSSPARPTA